MNTRYDPAKAAHAAGHLLRLRGGSMSYLKLIKLLYLLDRESFKRYGQPVTGDRYVSMKLGPVLSRVRDSIMWEASEGVKSPWHDLIESSGNYEVHLKDSTFDPDALSPRQVALVEEIFRQFGEMSRWELVEYTHRLPEWRDPPSDDTSLPLHNADIMRALGMSQAEIEAALGEMADHSRMAELLAIP